MIIILNMLNNYEIRNKINYIIMNNAYFNDTFIEIIIVFLRDERVTYNT